MAFGNSFNAKVVAIAAVLSVASWASAQAGALENDLFESVRKNDLGGVRATLDAGADVFATNMLGNRPADVAVDLGYFDVAHYLLSVMDHQRRARAAQDQPAEAPETPPAASPPPAVVPPAPAPLPKSEQTQSPSPAPFDTAAADAIFTPPKPPAPQRETMTTGKVAATTAVPKILPAPPPPSAQPNPKVASQPKPVSAPVAHAVVSPRPPSPQVAETAPTKPKQTLDDIIKSVGKTDSVLHVPPGPKPQSQQPQSQQSALPTPKPIGLYAQDGTPNSLAEPPAEVQPAVMTETETQPMTVAFKAEEPQAVEPDKKASVLYVDAPSHAQPPQVSPQTQQHAKTVAVPSASPPKTENETGWFGKMKSFLGMGEETKGAAATTALASSSPAPTPSPPQSQSAQSAQSAKPLETASIVPVVTKPAAQVYKENQTLRLSADLALGKSLPYDDLKAAPCVDKRRRGVVCLETVDWPKDLQPYFADMNSTLYRGTKAVVGYQGQKSTFLYAVFPSTAFKSVVALLTDRFGPPIKSQRGVRPVGEDLQANLVRIWSGADAEMGQPMTLEVAMYDDQRDTFPVMHEGALKLTYTGFDSAFRYVEPIELQRFK